MTQDTQESNRDNLSNQKQPPVEQTQSSVRADIEALDQFALVGLLDVIGQSMESSTSPWTASDLIEKLDVAQRHHWIIERWLTELAPHGLIEGDETGWTCAYRPSREQLRTIRTNMADAASRLGYGPIYVETVLESLGRTVELLRDEVTIQSLLFPNGTIEFAKDVYETNTVNHYLNTAAAEAIAALGSKPTRVLELGAGIGATTSAVAASDAIIGHYAYTDLSLWFLSLGLKRFAEQLPLSTHILNIEDEFAPQLSEPNTPSEFDVVVAANVAHNAPDIGALLDRIRNVLRPGGHLLLIELVEEHPYTLPMLPYVLSLPLSHPNQEILDSGSGLRRHDIRSGSNRTLLSDSEWRTQLAAHNFDVQTVFPDRAHPLYPASQRLFTAQMTSTSKETA